MSNSRKERGFTLLELMITIAIISILVVVATPLYMSYSMRAKIGGELLQISPLKNLVVEHYMINGEWGTSNQMVGGKAPESYGGRYVQSVSVSDTPTDGSLKITYNIKELPTLIGENTLVFTPDESSGNVQWVCQGGSLNERYLPPQCS